MGSFAADLASFQDIPTPIAPARPAPIPVTLGSGQTGFLDQSGNITDSSGNLITAIPGSTSTTPSTTSTGATNSQGVSFNDILNGLQTNTDPGLSATSGAAVTSPSNKGILGISEEDAIIVIIGILLIAAGIFAFKQTSTVINTVGRTARHISEATA